MAYNVTTFRAIAAALTPNADLNGQTPSVGNAFSINPVLPWETDASGNMGITVSLTTTHPLTLSPETTSKQSKFYIQAKLPTTATAFTAVEAHSGSSFVSAYFYNTAGWIVEEDGGTKFTTGSGPAGGDTCNWAIQVTDIATGTYEFRINDVLYYTGTHSMFTNVGIVGMAKRNRGDIAEAYISELDIYDTSANPTVTGISLSGKSRLVLNSSTSYAGILLPTSATANGGTLSLTYTPSTNGTIGTSPIVLGNETGANFTFTQTVEGTGTLTLTLAYGTSNFTDTIVTRDNKFYIDYAGGNDANAATKASPWKRDPYMVGWAGTYSHQAGDAFIFKGGVTWPAGCFTMAVTAGGDSNGQDYHGIDATWYTGGSWTNPVFDAQSTAIGQFMTFSADYVKVEKIHFTNFYWNSSTSAFGNADILMGSNSHLTFSANIHDKWAHSNIALDPTVEDVPVYLSSTSGSHPWGDTQQIIGCLFQGATDGSADSRSALYGGGGLVQNNTVSYLANGFRYQAANSNIIGNRIGPIVVTFDGTHENGVEDQNTFGGTVTVAGNYIFDVCAVCAAIGGGNSITYCYNNIFEPGAARGIPLEVANQGGSNSSNGSYYVYNNALICSGSGDALPYYVPAGCSMNNFSIINNFAVSTAVSIGGSGNNYTSSTNIILSATSATADGYTSANLYAPTSPTSPTVGAGTDLSSIFTTDFLGNTRRTPWDVGPYDYVADLPPVTLTSPRIVFVDNSLVFTASAETDPVSGGTESGMTLNAGVFGDVPISDWSNDTTSGTVSFTITSQYDLSPDEIMTATLNATANGFNNVAAFGPVTVQKPSQKLKPNAFTATLTGPSTTLFSWDPLQATVNNFSFDVFTIWQNGVVIWSAPMANGSASQNVGVAFYQGSLHDNAADSDSWLTPATGNAQKKTRGAISPFVLSYLLDDLLP